MEREKQSQAERERKEKERKERLESIKKEEDVIKSGGGSADGFVPKSKFDVGCISLVCR